MFIHGHSRKGKISPEFRTWTAMKTRCMNPNELAFKDYGGRGISICARWLVFANFLSDLGTRPSKRHWLERINNDGNYEPSNCCWATQQEQANNRRSNRIISFGSESKTLAQWSRVSGIDADTIAMRIIRGATPANAIFTRLR